MELPKGQVLRADELAQDEQVSCDVAVIGSGAGGAAAAWALVQAGLSVLLVEEGKKWEPQELSTKQSWALRHLYAERGTSLATGNIYLPMPRGKAVGGSTLLNSAICFRTPKRVLDAWRTVHGLDWADEEKLGPVFTEVEQLLAVVKVHEGIAKQNALLFKKGAEALKLEGDFISRNAPGCVGCGVCQMGCPIGGKFSTDRAVVPRFVEKGGALLTCARVVRLLVEGGAAVGLEAVGVDPFTEEPKKRVTVRAKKVFLCAGAVSSPMLLLRQGLANASGLVGEGLHVHTAVGVAALFDEVVDAWHGATQGYYAHLDGEAAILETFSATPDVYQVQYQAYARPVDRLRHLATCGCMIGDTSSGTVRPGKSDGRSVMTYDVNDEDVRVMKKGLGVIAKAYFAAGAKEVLSSVPGASPAKSVAEFEALLAKPEVGAAELGVYASHPMSTCRMGADPKTSVVRPDGEAHGVKNLVLADASVFPTSLGANPQITVATMATVVARAQVAKG